MPSDKAKKLQEKFAARGRKQQEKAAAKRQAEGGTKKAPGLSAAQKADDDMMREIRSGAPRNAAIEKALRKARSKF